MTAPADGWDAATDLLAKAWATAGPSTVLAILQHLADGDVDQAEGMAYLAAMTQLTGQYAATQIRLVDVTDAHKAFGVLSFYMAPKVMAELGRRLTIAAGAGAETEVGVR